MKVGERADAYALRDYLDATQPNTKNHVGQGVKFNGRDAHAYLQPNALSKYLGFANQSQMDPQYNRENLIEVLNRQYEGNDEVNKLMWLLK